MPRGRDCLAGSAVAGYLLELTIIASTSALISWICQLIHTRWPFIFPLLSDANFILALGVASLLTVHLSALLSAHARLLAALGNLGAYLPTDEEQTSQVRVLVAQIRASINKESEIAAISGLARKQGMFPAVLRACTQIEDAYLLLESRLLHRMTMAAVYLLALTLPWTLWYQFQWFTVLVVPLAMTPFLLMRQYGAKLRARGRAANRDHVEWQYLDLRLDQISLRE